MNASFLFHRDRLAKADYWDWAAQKRGIFFFFWNHNSSSLFSHSSFLGNRVPLSYGSHRWIQLKNIHIITKESKAGLLVQPY